MLLLLLGCWVHFLHTLLLLARRNIVAAEAPAQQNGRLACQRIAIATKRWWFRSASSHLLAAKGSTPPAAALPGWSSWPPARIRQQQQQW
jgi:hypothetical protein